VPAEACNGWQTVTTIFPEDVNRVQVFDLRPSEQITSGGASALKLVFEESSDFFGRITIYDLKVEGTRTTT